MKRNKLITVFEYQRLKFSSINLTGRQIQLLAEFASGTREKYFQVGYNSVRFASYVGILQIEDITIEILPKIERATENEANIARWRYALLEMLHIAGIFPVDLDAAAYTKLRESTLLDVLFLRFTALTEKLLKDGLIKKYSKVKRDLSFIKGNIDVKKNITKNAAHKERAYCRFTQYNSDNLFNQILLYALEYILQSAHSPEIVGKAREMLLHFDSVTKKVIKPVMFGSLHYDRKAGKYRDAIKLAELIITGFSPLFHTGSRNVFALLFDMNELFETYISEVFKKNLRSFPKHKILIQRGKYFWENKKIRPDIIIEHPGGKVAIDTKWKVISERNPSDPDLKQMYVYSRFFGCEKTHLLYPRVQDAHDTFGRYSDGYSTCSATFIDLFQDDGKLRKDFTADIKRIVCS